MQSVLSPTQKVSVNELRGAVRFLTCKTRIGRVKMGMVSDFVISEKRDDELVLLNPEHLVLHHSQTAEDAMIISKLAKKICQARWPKAYIKIYDGQNYILHEVDWLFILVGYRSKVGEDFDREIWAESGAFIREEVVDEIVAEAMALAGKMPSAALRRRLSVRRSRLAKAGKQKGAPPKRRSGKGKVKRK